MNKFNLKNILLKLSLKKFKETDFDDYFALYDKGYYREAYDVLRGILQSNAHWSKVGDMYVWCANLEFLVNDDVHKALKLLDKALELGCHFMASYYNVHGYMLWRVGECSMGIQELEKSVALKPYLTNLTNLGIVLTSSDDKRAIGIWRRVLKIDPNNCSAHIYLAQESVKSGDHGKAILMVKRAEILKPKVSDFIRIGNLYRDLGQIQNALNAFLEAYHLGYEPKAPLYASISDCYFSLGDKKLARKYAEWAFQLDPNNDYVKEVWHDYQDLR